MKFQMVANSTAIIESNDLAITDLIEVSFHKKKEIAFRAAWMLEYVMTHRPAQFASYIESLLELLPKQKNPSAQRHYTKIIALMTAANADPVYKELTKKIDFDATIEVLFTWLIDPEILVATKVHCMQSLANLAPRYDWIKDDLEQTIDYLKDKESIAFFARARMVQKQLKKVK